MSTWSTSPDWLERLGTHEPAAWERLARDYKPLILAALRGAPRSVEPQDLLQDVLRRAADGLPRFERQRTGSLRAWLRVLARRAVADAWRAAEKQPQARGESVLDRLAIGAPEIGDSTVGSSYLRRQERVLEALEAVRARVHESTWEAFTQTVLEGRAPVDVADDMGMSPVAVRVAKSRVLARLRTALE